MQFFQPWELATLAAVHRRMHVFILWTAAGLAKAGNLTFKNFPCLANDVLKLAIYREPST